MIAQPFTDLALPQHRRVEPWRPRNCFLLIAGAAGVIWAALGYFMGAF
jgi:hypothetical protein